MNRIVVERPFGTFNTELFSTLPGYTGSNVQERPEKAEKEATLTLRELERLLVRYMVDRYNQSIDARMGDQTRFQRWEAGLIAAPSFLSERELDICLMKQTRRSIYRGGYLQFENLTYRGENLAGYAGERVVLRYNPRDITTVLVYRSLGEKEEFLARANATDLEAEQLSMEEAKASSRKIRNAGKTVGNRSILAEVCDRDTFVLRHQSRKERQKTEQAEVRYSTVPAKPPIDLLLHSRSQVAAPPVTQEEVETAADEPLSEMPEVFDYEQMREDYGF